MRVLKWTAIGVLAIIAAIVGIVVLQFGPIITLATVGLGVAFVIAVARDKI